MLVVDVSEVDVSEVDVSAVDVSAVEVAVVEVAVVDVSVVGDINGLLVSLGHDTRIPGLWITYRPPAK
jgi:hypothetical protein